MGRRPRNFDMAFFRLHCSRRVLHRATATNFARRPAVEQLERLEEMAVPSRRRLAINVIGNRPSCRPNSPGERQAARASCFSAISRVAPWRADNRRAGNRMRERMSSSVEVVWLAFRCFALERAETMARSCVGMAAAPQPASFISSDSWQLAPRRSTIFIKIEGSVGALKSKRAAPRHLVIVESSTASKCAKIKPNSIGLVFCQLLRITVQLQLVARNERQSCGNIIVKRAPRRINGERASAACDKSRRHHRLGGEIGIILRRALAEIRQLA